MLFDVVVAIAVAISVFISIFYYFGWFLHGYCAYVSDDCNKATFTTISLGKPSWEDEEEEG